MSVHAYNQESLYNVNAASQWILGDQRIRFFGPRSCGEFGAPWVLT